MKTIGVILVGLFLVACAPVPTLEELEDQANLTGDWSQVERRERAIAKRHNQQNQRLSQCSYQYVEICDSNSDQERCQCVAWEDLGVSLHTDW